MALQREQGFGVGTYGRYECGKLNNKKAKGLERDTAL
jgi:hypothetical protein